MSSEFAIFLAYDALLAGIRGTALQPLDGCRALTGNQGLGGAGG